MHQPANRSQTINLLFRRYIQTVYTVYLSGDSGLIQDIFSIYYFRIKLERYLETVLYRKGLILRSFQFHNVPMLSEANLLLDSLDQNSGIHQTERFGKGSNLRSKVNALRTC